MAVSSGFGSMDLLQAGIHKAWGLAQLMEMWQLNASQVMAFGDNFNDLPMLEAAGCPYIMDNAAPELREKFPNHCRRVEDVLRTL